MTASAPSSSSSSPRRVHSVRFYRPPPSAVHCMDFCAKNKLLALSRADNSVEVWNMASKTHFLQKAIPGTSESSVEAVCWAKDGRLFAATTHGLVLELDLATLTTRRQFAVTAGAAWCMGYSAAKNRLAVGTEEGYVCLVEVTDDGMEFDRVLDKQEGRILCLDWHSSGEYIVTGSADTVRVWSVASGHPTARMTTGRSERHRETVVWSVRVTDDLTVVSGDSRGKTCFWSGRTGTLVDAYQTHLADVLSVCLNEEQNVAYSSGVEPNIVHFQPIRKKDGRSKWVKSVHRVVHTHDVRAMVAATLGSSGGSGGGGSKTRKVLISAGVDAQIAVNDPASKMMARHSPLPHGGCVAVAAGANMVLLRYPTFLELWSLGRAASTSSADGEQEKAGSVLSLEEDAAKLLELRTKDEEPVRACAISYDGHFVAYATPTRLRVYRVTADRSKAAPPSVKRLHLHVSGAARPAHHLAFCRARGELVAAADDSTLQFFSLDGDDVRLADAATDLGLVGGISHLSVETGCDLAAAADHSGNVCVVDLAARRLVSRMPRYEAAPLTSLSVDPRRETVLIVHADHKILECHMRTARFSKFSTRLHLPKIYKGRRLPARGAFRTGENKIVVYDEANICVVERNSKSKSPAARAKRKKNGGTSAAEGEEGDEASVSLIKKYEHLAHLSPLSDGSLVAVEVRPASFEEQLPPSLKQKKYGAM